MYKERLHIYPINDLNYEGLIDSFHTCFGFAHSPGLRTRAADPLDLLERRPLRAVEHEAVIGGHETDEGVSVGGHEPGLAVVPAEVAVEEAGAHGVVGVEDAVGAAEGADAHVEEEVSGGRGGEELANEGGLLLGLGVPEVAALRTVIRVSNG